MQGSIRSPQAITEAAGFGPPLHAQIQAALTWVPGQQARDDHRRMGGRDRARRVAGAVGRGRRGRVAAAGTAGRAAPFRGGRAVMAGRRGTDGRRARRGAGADMAVRPGPQQAAAADLRGHRPVRLTLRGVASRGTAARCRARLHAASLVTPACAAVPPRTARTAWTAAAGGESAARAGRGTVPQRR